MTPSNEKIKIVITGKLHDIALELLKNPPKELQVSSPFELVYIPDAPKEQILKEIENAQVLISRSEPMSTRRCC
jgi:D-3-phosphoglycerate dehydrogenase